MTSFDETYALLEEAESEMGWNTPENISRAEDQESRREQELKYSLVRAQDEVGELLEEEMLDVEWSSPDPDQQKYVLSSEKANRIGSETADLFLFLRKALEATKFGSVKDEVNQILKPDYNESDSARSGERVLDYEERKDLRRGIENLTDHFHSSNQYFNNNERSLLDAV